MTKHINGDIDFSKSLTIAQPTGIHAFHICNGKLKITDVYHQEDVGVPVPIEDDLVSLMVGKEKLILSKQSWDDSKQESHYVFEEDIKTFVPMTEKPDLNGYCEFVVDPRSASILPVKVA